ncbi:prolyl oligopeptidase family serine peptidase [Kitasatospora viridis]|uniref:prolyl oligopeptidase n=1 Tax=Kitasatospora viridis TaxID=281105 RepID=A0A561T782_9ACTN|nr:prolyl oligopeptidase family serine peptidase [Kitasatospora viridis]TWF82957.1 prolyl oligopeptidase [Kitasatospora viridis]
MHSSTDAESAAPPAPRSPTAADQLGERTVPDPYRPLEDPRSPGTLAWAAAQRDLYARTRKSWPSVEEFRSALTRLTSFDHLTPPQFAGGQAFFTQRGADADRPVLVVERDGVRRTLVDPGAQGVLGAWVPDPTGRLVAHQLAEGGSEEYTLRITAVADGRTVDQPVEGCRYGAVAWTADGSAFYYGRGEAVRLHRIGTPGAADTEVLTLPEGAEPDVTTGAGGDLLVVVATDQLGAGNRLWTADLRQAPWEQPQLTELASEGWTTPWPAADGTLYLLTDADAPRGRLLVRPPGAAHPRELLPEDEHAVLDSFAILDGPELARPELLALRSLAGRPLITRHDLHTGAPLGELALPGGGAVTELTFHPGGHQAWFGYSDRTTPETVHRYDARTGELTVWRSAGLPGPVPELTVSEVEYRASDGTPVRLLLTRPAGAPPGPLPTVLQGYGAFGEPQVADYYAAALAWAEWGGQFAVACVRGGGEHGEEWHRAGMREHKQRGIDDFTDAARHLLAAGYCAEGQLGAFGQSAGGLLVAAALTQHPELFGAVAATAAPLDLARYQLTGYGPYWTEEFGDREVPEELGWLLGYSPYHRVRQGAPYPAVLLTAFDDDARVDPLHSRKMCAALQHATGSGRPVLLRQGAGLGHGVHARPARLSYFADVLAFFAAALERKPELDHGHRDMTPD